MIIDAMDILHAGIVRGFCIVSSDSDYTRLATRIREAGLFVMGIGESKTPEAFRRACHIFVLVENLAPAAAPASDNVASKRGEDRPAPPPHLPPTEALKTVQQAFDTVDRGEGQVHMANLGSALYRLDPGFDPRTYGKAKLAD